MHLLQTSMYIQSMNTPGIAYDKPRVKILGIAYDKPQCFHIMSSGVLLAPF